MPPRKSKKMSKEELLETTYKTKIKYMCPVRGIVEEEVEVRRYSSIAPPEGSVIDAEELEVLAAASEETN
jgi:hypothetical protein